MPLINIIDGFAPGGFASVPACFACLAVFSWALSGAVVGARSVYAIAGVFVIALVSSMGGSLLRSGFFLQRTPPGLTTGIHLALIMMAMICSSVNRFPRMGPPSGIPVYQEKIPA